MSLSTSIYVPGDSWLHRIDPRVKLAFAVGGMVTLLSLGNLPLFVAFLAVCHVVLLSAGVPVGRLAWAWRLMLPVTFLIPILWPVFSTVGASVLFELGPVTVTALDVWQALAMAARVDAMAFAFFVWLFTTDQTSMIMGLVGLGVPYQWGLMMAIALRYVPTLYESFQRVMDAQRARGLVIARWNPVRAGRAYVPALVAMLIGSLRAAERLAWAMEARAFGAAGRERTVRRQLHFRPVDGVAAAIVILGFTAVIVARVLFGFGQQPLSLF
ncbi:MAG: Energy-coupling factor transporter transmembrane protein EcfT [Anaerolineales bacterium]|nr:Energy-coupling factor transporter transmembrane protein EcfT [Anaerolineales bacterium]